MLQPLERSPSSTHSLRCSDGFTVLQKAMMIDDGKPAVAYLRSIGAKEDPAADAKVHFAAALSSLLPGTLLAP